MKYFLITQYSDSNTAVGEKRFSAEEAQSDENITAEISLTRLADGGIHTQAGFLIKKAYSAKSSIGFVLEEGDWNFSNYVFAPAALYNGNRFDCLCKPYPPMLTAEEALRYKNKTVITDVPRLNKNADGSAQLSSGDLSFPCVGYFSSKKKEGYLLFFCQGNELGDFGVTVSENMNEKTARFALTSPRMRVPCRYEMCTTNVASGDTPTRLKAGEKITFSFTEYHFPCENEAELLNRYFEYRQNQPLPKSRPNGVPWNYAFRLIEEKYNKRNWQEDFGFYTSSEATSGICRQWQTGWVGGAMNTLPGLMIGSPETKEKSRKTLDFVFDKIQDKSGFLYGLFCDGRAYGDDFFNQENINIVMSRKNADALYYIAKQLLYLRNENQSVNPKWEKGLEALANAFASFYEKNRQIGQFIDIEKQEPYVYGSASGGLVGAGLALCSVYFECPEYLSAAAEITEEFYNDYVAKGYSTGGPGEILSCPDSESAFALLESFVMLYRVTQEEKWLKYSKDAASLCASWCVGYDYAYESDTQFYSRKTATTGAVWASVQNKHAAPGICTMSGESLLHLFRATGNRAYLELLADISHNITQYVSTPENPMYASYVWHNGPAHRQKLANRFYAQTVFSLSSKSRVMKKLLYPLSSKILNPCGRINERVNLSDWEGSNNVGEVPLGSCWCEVSAMLTYLEIPAVYVQADTGFCFALDHIECSVENKTDTSFELCLFNPTEYAAQYRIFIDTAEDCKTALTPSKALSFKNVFLNAGESTKIKINRR